MGIRICRLEVKNEHIVPELPKIIAGSDWFKFLLATSGERGTLVLGPDIGPKHCELLPDGMDFVGAGIVAHIGRQIVETTSEVVAIRGDALSVRWESTSCLDEFNCDRPGNKYEADRLLRDVAFEVNQWINRTLSESK